MQGIKESQRQLKVGGIVPFSTTDFPGKLAAVIFVQGCPWQCIYCHNPHLQSRTEHSPVEWNEVLDMLERRTGLLDAVVFSGGEPTIDPELESAVNAVKELNFQVGLHTAGAYPRRLAEVLPLVDWVGIDAKAPFDDYERTTGITGSGVQALACAKAVVDSGVAHEFRTTIHPDLLKEDDLLAYANELAALGVKHYALQIFRDIGCENSGLSAISSSRYPSGQTIATIETLFETFTMRNA